MYKNDTIASNMFTEVRNSFLVTPSHKVRTRGFEKISFEQYCEDCKGARGDNAETYIDLKIPQRATRKSAGYDIYSPINFILHPNVEIKIATGIKAYMLDDEQLDIRIRSSAGIKNNIKLKNQLGLIDADYYNNANNEGHIWIALKNEGDKPWTINKGDAIAQGTFHKYLITDNDSPVTVERVGGIGSTNT